MHPLAAAETSSTLPDWVYLVVFAAAAAGYMGIPFIATVVIGTAAVLASQGELNIVAVLVVAAIGCEIGGLGGFRIGYRWGRQLLERPGPALSQRKKALAKGEQMYQKWGRAAVFVTPSIVSGTLAMKFRQFVVWNFLAGTAFVLAVGPAAYGAGQVSTGHHDAVSVGMLIGGIAFAALCVILAERHRRRHKAHRSDVGTPAEPTDPAIRSGP
jgi:membrane protein DedA with SNARE-associated domain